VQYSFDNHPWTDRTLEQKRSDGGIATDWRNGRHGHNASDSGFEFRTDFRIDVWSEHHAESDYSSRCDPDARDYTARHSRAHTGDSSTHAGDSSTHSGNSGTNSGNSGTDARNG